MTTLVIVSLVYTLRWHVDVFDMAQYEQDFLEQCPTSLYAWLNHGNDSHIVWLM